MSLPITSPRSTVMSRTSIASSDVVPKPKAYRALPGTPRVIPAQSLRRRRDAFIPRRKYRRLRTPVPGGFRSRFDRHALSTRVATARSRLGAESSSRPQLNLNARCLTIMLKDRTHRAICLRPSTVAPSLDQDCMVLEMDPAGHSLLKPFQSAYDEVRAEFGNSILARGCSLIAPNSLPSSRCAANRAPPHHILPPAHLDVVLKMVCRARSSGRPTCAVVEPRISSHRGFHTARYLIASGPLPSINGATLAARPSPASKTQLRISRNAAKNSASSR